ncbi:MAG: hypothetical protein JWN66_1366 [Sphingomonas bacterium]|uniref:hypothetical protein n=1 Tax=Sphingomonas bacterium TaxID=1895847 RepID=UPI0026256099|nr:hypothetical protein [Sphingomonas bacterium]MDB5704250.1 hypothetical protein [Sphingomonas bacterium]
MLLIALAIFAPKMPALVRADFDGDGRMDIARVATDGRQGYRLIVTRAADPDHPVTVHRMRSIRYFYIATARPGTYRSACDKGYGPDRAPCAYRRVRVTANTLSFGYRESSDAVAVWNKRRFDVVWLTD